MKWSIRYATGIDRIDTQHQMIFQMSEDFRASLDEGQGERVYAVMLESLHRFAKAHFGFEEQCMERYRCPVADANSQAHAKFLEVLSGFSQRFDSKGFDRADAHKLVAFVDQWLTDHICRIDIQLKP